jgi:broad specificity phosphatase PhoE
VNVFAIRHGETAWSLNGQHNGKIDIPLIDNGRRLAERLRVLATTAFALVLCSPMQPAGSGDKAVIDKYEGLTPKQIHEIAPGWLVFRDGCQGGESPEQVDARKDGLIARSPRPTATSHGLRADTRSASLSRAGSGCRRGTPLPKNRSS